MGLFFLCAFCRETFFVWLLVQNPIFPAFQGTGQICGKDSFSVCRSQSVGYQNLLGCRPQSGNIMCPGTKILTRLRLPAPWTRKVTRSTENEVWVQRQEGLWVWEGPRPGQRANALRQPRALAVRQRVSGLHGRQAAVRVLHRALFRLFHLAGFGHCGGGCVLFLRNKMDRAHLF